MTPRFIQIFGVSLLAFSTGCAGSYTAIRPDKIATYTSVPTSEPVVLAYQFDVLRLRGGNKKYIKKETKNGYHVTAVRVTNNSDREINFSHDLTLLYGDRPVMPVSSTIAAHDLRQGVAIYLLYTLLNLQVGGTRDIQTGVTTGGTFLPTGPFIAGGNMLGAAGANGNLRKEFEANDLTNRSIKPGETVYGIVSLRETSVSPIRVEMRTGLPAAAATPSATPAAIPVAAPH